LVCSLPETQRRVEQELTEVTEGFNLTARRELGLTNSKTMLKLRSDDPPFETEAGCRRDGGLRKS
jgi:hypothetical protein